MKTCLMILVSMLATSSAFAASDSVGVFYRPEKVNVLINENHNRSMRLVEMMEVLGLGGKATLISPDGSIKMDCGVGEEGSGCTFRFLPSAHVTIGHKNVEVVVTAEDLKLPQAPNFEMVFESSMADRFVMQVSDGKVYFFANKRGGEKN
ncbi:hypothetical protein [Bdellovibrio sp. BCCA]|uniref:hypothetical protein n=1 Tax=Bdellovibrio sp. BCCA TaxID=3136281 RepID=UPI0030F00277